MKKFVYIFLLIVLSFNAQLYAQVSQIDIPRIEMMPNEPSPYNVRDWKMVAIQYDSFVYDAQKTGTHLPLISLNTPAFGLHTYVGTNSTSGREGINILPSLVGATLVGVDKSNFYGQNWVLKSQDFFNSQSGQGIYLNNPGGSSGNDWWYETMPNVYFYQLYDLYPQLGGDEEAQFISVADRFLEATKAMGGSETPWQQAYMNYRAWDFSNMKPNEESVPEPEAAGAFAWVLYNAFVETGNPKYLKGAEWSMEFLDDWSTNPSYELQLPYGIYTAARMNAEIGTDYDIEKMVNWAFDRGALRGWGAIVGKWGGFDVHGLIGEANDNGDDYAFQMNGLHQVAALAPMVRYDKRFAHAIGKWILNVSNATRLFYPGFLPDFLQDSHEWSNEYDSDRVIGYEALREKWEGNSPFSTGDAIKGGWAATNLALYGTSSIGYLGAILEATNDPKIFKLDLLKTDFFNDQSYPTFLYFNPYDAPTSIEISLGNEAVDVYDLLSENFLMEDVNGNVELTIPADGAIVVTLAPAGGAVSYVQNKMLINQVVVDYLQTAEPIQYVPRIQALATENIQIEAGDSVTIFAKAFDKDSPLLSYSWQSTGGVIHGSDSIITWVTPTDLGEYEVQLILTDETNLKDTATLNLQVVAEINVAPEIIDVITSRSVVDPDQSVDLVLIAEDQNGDDLTYTWHASGGEISGEGTNVVWMAPSSEGDYQITITVMDDAGLSDESILKIWVKTFKPTSGNLIAWYPFNMNGNDISGNELNGQVFGATYTDDFNGKALSALRTDGINDRVTVSNNPLLNVQDAITVSCWFNLASALSTESFLISHGSWQNRWKISITPEQKVRWTVNTINGITDLDSKVVEPATFYHVTAVYDGENMTLYINGALQGHAERSGNIRTTDLALLMGQMLPDNTQYNFMGVLDEVKVFDYAFTPDGAMDHYQQTITSIKNTLERYVPLVVNPNPTMDLLHIQRPEGDFKDEILSIYNRTGQLIHQQTVDLHDPIQLSAGKWQSGMYFVTLRSNDKNFTARFIKI